MDPVEDDDLPLWLNSEESETEDLLGKRPKADTSYRRQYLPEGSAEYHKICLDLYNNEVREKYLNNHNNSLFAKCCLLFLNRRKHHTHLHTSVTSIAEMKRAGHTDTFEAFKSFIVETAKASSIKDATGQVLLKTPVSGRYIPECQVFLAKKKPYSLRVQELNKEVAALKLEVNSQANRARTLQSENMMLKLSLEEERAKTKKLESLVRVDCMICNRFRDLPSNQF